MGVDYCPIVVLVVVTLGFIVGVVLSGIILTDYNETRGFSKRMCSSQLDHTDVHPWADCARGKVVTRYQNATGEFDQSVELYYPTVNWVIVCEDNKAVENWIGGMQGSGTFTCWIDHPDAHTGLPDGIRAHFDGIVGWGFVMAFSLLGLCLVVFFALDVACCGKKWSKICCSCFC